MRSTSLICIFYVSLVAVAYAVCPTPSASSHAFPHAATVYYTIASAVPQTMVGPITDALNDWDNSNSNASGKNGSLVWFNLADQYSHEYIYLFLVNSGQFTTTDGKVTQMSTRTVTSLMEARQLPST